MPGSKEGQASHSIGQISSLMSLNVAPSDMTCIRLCHHPDKEETGFMWHFKLKRLDVFAVFTVV